MKLDTVLQPHCGDLGAGYGDLVTSLTTLIESLELPGTLDDEAATRATAARRALAAAIGAERQLVSLNERILHLETLAITDPLTGLCNRRGFEAELTKTLSLARRYGESGVILYLDLDGFKQVNDVHGHAAGDQVLKQVAKVLNKATRGTDTVARLGGDEFAIILYRAAPDGGRRRAQSIERQINSTVVFADGQPIVVRGSVGAHGFGPQDTTDEILRRADGDMYKRKRHRVRVRAHLRAA